MALIAFLILLVALYGYVAHKAWKAGNKTWLVIIFFAILFKFVSIGVMIAKAPPPQ